jgi:hypothetical protein
MSNRTRLNFKYNQTKSIPQQPPITGRGCLGAQRSNNVSASLGLQTTIRPT